MTIVRRASPHGKRGAVPEENHMAAETNMKKGIALAAAAAALWSISGVLIKGISWDGFSVAGFRSLIAAGTILIFMKRTRFRFTFSSVGAVIAYACTVTCIGIANKNTTSANAVLLQFTSPVFTAVLGWWFLRERVTRTDIISICMIFAGMFVFVADGLSSGHIKGDLLALLAGFSFGSMCVLLRIEKDTNPVQYAFWGNILSFIICLPFMKHAHWSFQNTSIILILGIFQLGLSYILFTKAISHITFPGHKKFSP